VYISKVGGIICPTLQDIADIGGDSIYQYYLNILIMDASQLFTILGKADVYEAMTDEERLQLNVYDILIGDDKTAELLRGSLDFFVKEDVVFIKEHRVFEVKGNVFVKENEEMVEKYITIGVINRENFSDVVDVICQRNNIKNKDDSDPKKAKSKKALAILEKLKKGRESMTKTKKTDENMELGNIISAVANKSQSLNITNIWCLTVYQLWDCFFRLTNNAIYDIGCTGVSVWGDRDNKFDYSGWYKKMNR
jgi:hypothetical protein